MALLNTQIEVLTESTIEEFFNGMCKCLSQYGISIPAKGSSIDELGLSALLNSLLHAVEQVLTKALIPIIEMIKTALISIGSAALPPAVPAIFATKAGLLNTDLVAFIANPLNEIVNALIGPIKNNINIPFPKTDILIKIITGAMGLNQIISFFDNPAKYLDMPIIFDDMNPVMINAIMDGLFKQGIDGTGNIKSPAFVKILSLILFPICLLKTFITLIISLVKDLITNIFKTISSLVKIISDPVSFFKDLFADALALALKNLITKFPESPAAIFVPIILCFIKNFIDTIFKVDNLLAIILSSVLNISISDFLKDIKGNTKKFLADLKTPPMEIISYKWQSKTITVKHIENGELIGFTDAFAVGDEIEFYHTRQKKTYKSIINEVRLPNQLILKNDPSFGIILHQTQSGEIIRQYGQDSGSDSIVGVVNIKRAKNINTDSSVLDSKDFVKELMTKIDNLSNDNSSIFPDCIV